MRNVRGAVVVALIVATAAMVGACRREVPAEPMKLGADVPAVTVTR